MCFRQLMFKYQKAFWYKANWFCLIWIDGHLRQQLTGLADREALDECSGVKNQQLVVKKAVSFRPLEGYCFAQTEEIRPERSEVLAPEQATTSCWFLRNGMNAKQIP